jgi:anaerobic selenocysteine-containing dehydrogenase
VLGGNPMRALPEPERLRSSLSALETLAVVDVVTTDTAALATHVLPATGQLERADIPLSIDQFVVTLSTQYTPAVVEPGESRRHAWWIFAQLAERLGVDVLPGGMTSSTCTDDDLLRVLVDRSRGSWDDLVSERVAVVPPVYGWVLEGVLPGGRWRIAPELLVEQFQDLAPVDPPPLALVPRRQVRHLNSQLVDGTDGFRVDDAVILVSPADAAAAGVGDGCRAVVRSRHGSVEGVVRVTDEVRPGAVSVPHGFGAPNVSHLTSAHDDIDPHTGMVLQSGVAVSLAPVGTTA